METVPPTFGELLRRHRLAAGLSQEALAERAGLSARGVSDLERGVHRAPRRDTVALLATGLDLDGAARAALAAAVRSGRAPRARPAPALPVALTSFVGRERELAEVRQLLGATRLLTLTGAGGIGKTRLALQAAAEVGDDYPDGVWLVELAPLTDPTLAPQAVAAVLVVGEQPGRPLTETLAAALHPRRLLLVLDNCEHLVDACARLAEALLTGCPGLTVLATSRELLGVPGEAAWRVPSLAAPDPQRLPPRDELLGYEALRLFVERARLAQADFAITDANATAVAEVCRRLDGLPLAIELAAARVTALSVEQIAARLDDRFRLLTGGRRTGLRRQQTLQAAMAWSYDLLTGPERALLRRLSVFAGGWTLAAAEDVCAGAGIAERDVLELLTRLVEKSLVVAEPGVSGSTRYRLLETVRQYAAERLAAAGEAVATRDRHLAVAVALGEQAEPVLWENANERDEWLLRLQLEHDNLRAALAWGLERDPAAGLRLGVSLAEFWRWGRLQREGWRWLEALLARAPGGTALHGYALLGAGRLYREQGELAHAEERLTAAASIFEAVDDRRGLATALSRLGLIAEAESDGARARALQERSLALCRAVGDRHGLAVALLHLGEVLTAQGAMAEARTAFEESLPHFRVLGEVGRVAHVLSWLSVLARLARDFPRARALVTEALAVLEPTRFKDPYRTWVHHALFGDLALDEGELAEAAAEYRASLATALASASRPATVHLVTLLGVLAIRQGTAGHGVRWLAAVAPEPPGALKVPGLYRPELPAERDCSLASARAALGAAAFAAAWAVGGALSPEAAAAEALADEFAAMAAVAPPVVAPLDPAGLSRREVEVLRLMARGTTDAAIAAALRISVRTVNGHVAGILGKTGCPNRTAAAAFARDHGLA
jgi:non-specific serine/threonine protein kinase